MTTRAIKSINISYIICSEIHENIKKISEENILIEYYDKKKYTILI